MAKNLIELTEEEINEASAAAMGYAAEREFVSQHSNAPIVAKKSKYHVKNKTTGKIMSTHANAPDAVRARAKMGGADTHSIIKEEFTLTEEVRELIDAISAGKTLDIDASFNEIMSNKLSVAIDNHRIEIASNLFSVQEEAVEEAVVPGSVKKDKDGNVLSAKTVPDAPKDSAYDPRAGRRNSADDRKPKSTK
jgi:hypothetical protein